MGLLHLTTHDDRVAIDKEIEVRTGIYCDNAIDRGILSKDEFEKIVSSILDRKKKRKEAAPLVA
jgi:hypothetical protein